MTDLPAVRERLLETFGLAIAQVKRPLKAKPLKEWQDLVFNFKPNSAQLSFLYSDATVRCLSGSNRLGKTEMNAAELFAFCTGFRPYMADLDGIIENLKQEQHLEVYLDDENTLAIRSKIVPIDTQVERFDRTFEKAKLRELYMTPFVFNEARVLCSDLQHHAKTVFGPKLKRWLYPFIASSRKNQMGIETFFEFEFLGHEATLDIVSDIVPDKKMWEGWDGEVIAVDEPISRDCYVATYRGLSEAHGKCWLTFTPLSQPWMYYQFKRKADGQRVFWEEGDIETNRHNLRKGYIEEFEAELTDDEKEARLHGRFQFLTGLVFRIFSRPRYVLKDEMLPPRNALRYRAIDVHWLRRPQAVLYVAILETNKALIYHEIWQVHTAKSLAKEIKDYEDQELMRGAPHVWEINDYKGVYFGSLIDPISSAVDPISGTSFADELVSEGVIDIAPGSKDKQRGDKVIKKWLESDRILINPSCTRIIFEFENYSHKDPKPSLTDKALDQAKDKDNDMLENLRRILIEDPLWTDVKNMNEPFPYEQWCNQNLEF